MSSSVSNRARAARVASLVALCVVLAACSSDQEPDGATLSITPADWSWDIVERLDADGRCVIDPERHADLPLVLALRDAQGSPIGDAELSVYTTLAGNTYSGFPVLALYDDRDGNGVVSGEEERISDADDPVARVRTSRFGGERTLLLRMNLSCNYRGSVVAVSEGGTSVVGSFAVVATETRTELVPEDDADPDPDPDPDPDAEGAAGLSNGDVNDRASRRRGGGVGRAR